MEKEILLSGALKEIEILEFKSGGNSYGAVVSDIKEILPYNKKPTPIPNSHPFIEGIIKPRDFLISIINFMDCLKLADIDDDKQEMLIVTRIKDLNIAFHVDSVSGIHRILNPDITNPDKKLSTTQKDVITGILTKEERELEIVDLRKIISNINPEINMG